MELTSTPTMDLTDAQYNILIDLAYRESGINLKGKHRLIETRLYQRFCRIGLKSVDEYFRLLQSNTTELASFIDAIATTHTYFFRESSTFKYLQKGVAASIWCAGCSSGEEPYSVVIDCLEKGFAPVVLATDISGAMLEQAEKGVYSLEKTEKMDKRLAATYFRETKDTGAGKLSIRPGVKQHVTFDRMNLITDAVPERKFDIIFCRNVMIYFDPPTKEKVLEKFYEALKPTGFLIIGGAESISFVKHRLKFIEPSVYQKA